MKKILILIVIAVLAAALAVGLVACNTGEGNSPSGGTGGFDEVDTAAEAYGFSAASAGMIISSMYQETPDAATASSSPATETPVPVSDETTAMLDGYMALVESLLADGGFTVSAEASDRTEYQVKTTVSYTDMSGEVKSYVMYYNETLRPDYDHDRDPYEEEEEYSISGIMIVDGNEYDIRGERSVESEPGEQEEELEFVVTLPEGRRMVVEQSVETEGAEHEREYSYSVFSGGTLLEESSFEYEQERGEVEIEMTYFNRESGGSQVFYFDKETVRGREVIRIRVGSMHSTTGYYVNITENPDGTNSYTYELMGRR